MNLRSLTLTLASSVLIAASALAGPAPSAPTPEPVPLVQETKKKDAKKDTAKKDATRPALKHYDVSKKGLAIDGYDPVAYFAEGGGKPKKGSKKITTTHRGVTYRFANETNRKAFLADPERFEPMYGGWCAWAMYDGKGSKTEPNPKSFTIEDDRLYLFYDGFFGDTKKSWQKKGSAPKLAGQATKNWERISGEKPAMKKDVSKKGDSKKGDANKGNA